MKIAILDTAYQQFLATLPPLTESYEVELAKYLSLGFGTFDAFSHYLTKEGHECIDIIANYGPLQRLWRNGQYGEGANPVAIALDQIKAFNPDVVLLQDLSVFKQASLRGMRERGIVIAAQCSCAFNSANAENLDAVFTSMPHFVEKFRAFGVPRVEYLPLAFDPRMLKYGAWDQCLAAHGHDGEIRYLPAFAGTRDIDISFVGGVGRNSHWKAGTDALEAVAARFGERFHWYGYGIENLSTTSPLRACYRGEAWGVEQYKIYGRSRVVVNRHGEIAQGFANNLRLFEATGMGACVFTEAAPNLGPRGELFPADSICQYVSHGTSMLAEIEYVLEKEDIRAKIAASGQQHTLKHHTYAQRMQQVSRVLSECLEGRKVAR